MKLIKRLATAFVLFNFYFYNAQVGINTDNPTSELDVNGHVNFRNEIKIGDVSKNTAKSGKQGEVLMSNGTGENLEWRTTKVGFYQTGQYKPTFSALKASETGIDFGAASTNSSIINSSIGDDINSTTPKWTILPNSSLNFTTTKENNRVYIIFQTGVEMSSVGTSTGQNTKFICGIFINDKLSAMRADQINGVYKKQNSSKVNLKNQSVYTLNYTATDVKMGLNKLNVACRRISATDKKLHLSIGKPIDNSSQDINAFMMRSIIKIDLNEEVILD